MPTRHLKMRRTSDWRPVAPSDRAVSPSATIEGANVPSKPSTTTGTLVLASAVARPRTITNAAMKHVHDMAYVSAKKPNAPRIGLEPLKCGMARSVVAIVPPPGSADVRLAKRDCTWIAGLAGYRVITVESERD